MCIQERVTKQGDVYVVSIGLAGPIVSDMCALTTVDLPELMFNEMNS